MDWLSAHLDFGFVFFAKDRASCKTTASSGRLLWPYAGAVGGKGKVDLEGAHLQRLGLCWIVCLNGSRTCLTFNPQAKRQPVLHQVEDHVKGQEQRRLQTAQKPEHVQGVVDPAAAAANGTLTNGNQKLCDKATDRSRQIQSDTQRQPTRNPRVSTIGLVAKWQYLQQQRILGGHAQGNVPEVRRPVHFPVHRALLEGEGGDKSSSRAVAERSQGL